MSPLVILFIVLFLIILCKSSQVEGLLQPGLTSNYAPGPCRDPNLGCVDYYKPCFDRDQCTPPYNCMYHGGFFGDKKALCR